MLDGAGALIGAEAGSGLGCSIGAGVDGAGGPDRRCAGSGLVCWWLLKGIVYGDFGLLSREGSRIEIKKNRCF